MNWGEIYNTARRALFNAGEIVRKSWALHFDPTPRDVNVSFYDENGELRTVAVPNLSLIKKRMWDDVNAAVGLWKRFLYVDVNGDDNNSGTASEPFRTIEKAISVIPTGGSGRIYLKGGQEHKLSNTITIENKHVTITCEPGTDAANYPTLTADPKIVNLSGNDYNFLPAFVVAGTLRIGWCKINVPAIQDSNIDLAPRERALVVPAYNNPWYGAPTISINYCQINLNKGFRLIDFHNWGGRSDLVSIQLWGNTIVINDTATPLIDFDYGIAGFYQNGNSLTDSSGNNLAWSDVISGIVKDSNGIPRNVVSNIIF